MPTVGIPAGGFKTVGQIVGTNAIQFHSGQDGMAITIEPMNNIGTYQCYVDRADKWIARTADG